MSSLKVRLSEADKQVVKFLRSKGVQIPELVRGTLRQEDQRRAIKRRRPKDVMKILNAIYERHPEPDDLPAPKVDPRDRHAVQAHTASRLTEPKSRSLVFGNQDR